MKDRLTIPNCITGLRIIGAVCLLFINPLSTVFYVVYTMCGLSDALDGLVARATKSTSEFGAKLDSVADLLFYSVMLIRILPALWVRLPERIWYWVGFILLLRLASYALVAVKYRRFAAQHTYLNKLTGFGVFLVPYFLKCSFLNPLCIIVCIISGIASLEELLIHICLPSYQPEVRTILRMQRKEPGK